MYPCTLINQNRIPDGFDTQDWDNLYKICTLLSGRYLIQKTFLNIHTCICRSSDVFKICGSLQFLSGLSLLIGLLSFPAGWDNDEVRGVCGSQVVSSLSSS